MLLFSNFAGSSVSSTASVGDCFLGGVNVVCYTAVRLAGYGKEGRCV